jgi:hypothetical protein
MERASLREAARPPTPLAPRSPPHGTRNHRSKDPHARANRWIIKVPSGHRLTRAAGPHLPTATLTVPGLEPTALIPLLPGRPRKARERRQQR